MGYKILVVDDEIEIRTLLASFLKKEGYDIDIAVDGIDALEKIKQSRPDLVISDIRMPRCDGFELLNSVTKLDPSLQILFVSGYVGMDSAEYAGNKCFAGFVPKPVKWSVLRSSIKDIQQGQNEG